MARHPKGREGELLRGIARALGDDRVYSVKVEPGRVGLEQSPPLDSWPLLVGSMLRNVSIPRVFHVVKPLSVEELVEAVRVAAGVGGCLHPWGRGSGVLGAAIPPPGCVALDLSGLNRVDVDPGIQQVVAEAGTPLAKVDEEARRHGFMLPLRPQSLELASVGGAISTLASGWIQPGAGNVEDVLIGIELVTGTGEVLRFDAPSPRGPPGPKIAALALGAEGALGVVARARMRLRRVPGGRARSAFKMPSLEAGLEAARELVQWSPPALLRLVDEAESTVLLGREGPLLLLEYYAVTQAAANSLLEAAREVAERLGGETVGRGPVDAFHRERGSYEDRMKALAEAGLWVDTIDLAAGWPILGRLWREAVRAAREINGVEAVMGHAGHFYPDGGALYLIVVGRGVGAIAAAWKRVMRVATGLGASVTHHHGIGRMKLRWAKAQAPDVFMALCRLAERLDPKGVFRGSPLRGLCRS